MKSIRLVATVSLIALCSAHSADAMSLKDALGVAYQNNPSIKAQRASLRATDESMPQALSGWLPTVQINYSRGKEDESIGGAADERINSNTRSLTLSQPVFDGGETYANTKRAKAQIHAARAELKSTEQAVLNNAVIAYTDVVRTREIYKLSVNNEKVLKEQLDAANDRFELGENTKTDVAQSESRLARATSDRITSHGDMIAAESAFKRLYEIDPPKSMRLPRKLPPIPSSLQEALELALAENPSLRSADMNQVAAKHNVTRQMSVLLPDVSVNGAINRSSGIGSRRGGEEESESISIDVTVPLFQGGAEYSSVREAKRQKEGARFTYNDTYNGVVDSTTESWQQIQTSKANVTANQANVKSATIALDGVREERDIGSRTTLDVLDAEQELFDARVQLITAKRNSIVANYNLLSAVGQLTANDLGLNVELYDPKSYYNKVKYKMIGF